jgi:hypothetical protein
MDSELRFKANLGLKLGHLLKKPLPHLILLSHCSPHIGQRGAVPLFNNDWIRLSSHG